MKKPATVNTNSEGTLISLAGNTYRTIISGAETGGKFAVIDMMVPPGGGPGPHAHKDIHETFYVVSGEVEFKTEEGNYTAAQGSFVSIPLGGIVHALKI